MRQLPTMIVAVALMASAAQAQTCSTPPGVTNIEYDSLTCGGNLNGPSYGPCNVNYPITFTPFFLSSNSSCDTYTWNFGDGGNPITAVGKVNHAFEAIGTYTVSLTASNAAGQSTKSVQLQVIYSTLASALLPAGDVDEGSMAVVQLTRYYTKGAASVHYATADDTAKAGVNYTAVSGTLSFADGQSTQSFSVPVLHDGAHTGTIQLRILLSNPSPGYPVEDSAIRISDLDAPPSLAISNYHLVESAGPQPIEIRRTGDMTGSVHLNYSVSAGSLQATSGTLTFGPNETRKTFNVTPVDDGVYTDSHFPTLNLSSPDATIFGGATQQVKIIDDEQPLVTVDDVSVTEGDNGKKDVTFTASVSAPTSMTWRVFYQTIPESAESNADFTFAAGYFYFDAGQTKQTITIPVIGDTKVEPNKTFRIALRVDNGSHPYPKLARNYAVCTILNDDAGLGPDDLRVPAGDTRLLTLRLAQPANAPISIALTSSVPGVANVPSTLQIAAGQQSATVEVTGLASGAATIRATLPDNSALGTNVSVYDPTILTMSPSLLTLPVGSSGTVTLSLTPPATEPVLVTLLLTDRFALTVPESVTIPPTGTASITVQGLSAGTAAVLLVLPSQISDATFVLPVRVTDGTTPRHRPSNR